jgi:hypothetical protein
MIVFENTGVVSFTLCMILLYYYGPKEVSAYGKAFLVWNLVDLISVIIRYVETLNDLGQRQMNQSVCST